MVQTILRVVNWYYLHDLGQDEIAGLVGASRSSVSRMITQARERGLVDIKPRIPGSVRPGMAAFLAELYGLRDVVIVEADPAHPEVLRDRLGETAACYLQLVLKAGTTVGISWGTMHTIDALQPCIVPGSRVVQFAGGLNQAPGIGQPLNELVQAMAAKLGASAHYLYAPAIPANVDVADTLRAEASIAEVLQIGVQADVALFGVGNLGPGTVIPAASALTTEEADRLRQSGAVGAVCVRFFDENGQVADRDIDARTIGITLEQLAAIPTKIAIVGGVRRMAALEGALRAGIVDVLITDEGLADMLLSARLSAGPKSEDDHAVGV